MKAFTLRRPLLAAVLAAALLLSSCQQAKHIIPSWNIGQRIREGGEQYTGVDIFRPVDGKLHQTPEQAKKELAYVRAPEVSYYKRTPLFTLPGPGALVDRATIRPTGREHVALVRCEPDYVPATRARDFLELADAIPPHARAITADALTDELAYKQTYPDSFGELTKGGAGWGRRLAAAPFEYVIDPALTVATLAVGLPVGIVVTPFVLIFVGPRGN